MVRSKFGIMNTLLETQQELAKLTALAQEVLGGECTPLDLDWYLDWRLRQSAARPQLVEHPGCVPVRQIVSGAGHRGLRMGIERFDLRLNATDRVTVLHLWNPHDRNCGCPLEDLWFARTTDVRRLYRHLRRLDDQAEKHDEPLLPADLRQRLWDNTIGFLQKTGDVFARYGIALKRGVMLLGRPGNGKTMAARWLQQQAERENLLWKQVTAAEFSEAVADRTTASLFSLSRPGIIMFDDFYRGIQDRERSEHSNDHSIMLDALDGLQTREGVVYLFTSNLTIAELDPAIRRPGRIDVLLTFEAPNAHLRRQYFLLNWPEEGLPGLSLSEAVQQTEGLSFAEMAELKKLLLMHYIEHDEWSFAAAWESLCQRRDPQRLKTSIGFAAEVARANGGDHRQALTATTAQRA